ncbi:MAG: hypothetical protein QG565_546 [Campylobacterota bacterium]|nr:hypothetical protein [Campylobacterota bacterium]MDQ1268013.1 hypothetical protein [Campylobacterota bacterium]MDQ1337911.1 hypothetical protein [Campylobacterota bacterium]
MNKDEMIEEAKKQLVRFQKEIDEIKEASSHLSIEAKKQFDIGAKELETLYSDAHKKFDTLSNKAEENFKEVKEFAELTSKALKHSFNYFMSHYRKK